MRVGFVTGEYPPMQGGVGAFTREIARAMVRMGHVVSVFTRSAVGKADEPGIAVAPVVGKRWSWTTLSGISDWVAAQELDILNIQFQTVAYDMHPVIHWLPRYVTAAPVVVTFHDLRVPYLFPKAGPVRKWIVRKLALDADAAIATDRADERTLCQDWRVPEVRWIPIGSNVTTEPPPEYDRVAWRRRLGVEPGDLLISYFGFLNESKGGLVLIEALARLVKQGIPAQLIMIGGRAGASDPTNVEYGRQVDATIEQHSLQGRVHWTGFVEDEQVSAHFLASDVTALPYLDGVSLRRGTLMAALAHGRAIVTTHPKTDAPELEHVVLTTPPDDAATLAETILTVWDDPALRAGMETAAKQIARLFTWQQIAEQTVTLYGELSSS